MRTKVGSFSKKLFTGESVGVTKYVIGQMDLVSTARCRNSMHRNTRPGGDSFTCCSLRSLFAGDLPSGDCCSTVEFVLRGTSALNIAFFRSALVGSSIVAALNRGAG